MGREAQVGVKRILCLILTGVVFLVWTATLYPLQVGASPDALPDLTVEISMSPALPAVGEQVTLDVIVRNVGGDAAGPIVITLYADPVDRPPQAGTLGDPTQIPSLLADRSFTVHRTYTFATASCDHIFYAWVDKLNSVTESNENNNLAQQQFCVGVTCVVDSYEPDDTCAAARPLNENASEARTFCNAGNQTLADEDWVKFTAFAGVTYTLATTNPAPNADPLVTVYNRCSGTPLAGPAATASWLPPASGVYVARLARDVDTQGPLTAYSLTLSVAAGVTDDFEPDNNCATARDITTNGTRQTHRFQTPGDEDWVKFAIQAGESFIVVADNAAAGVSPLVSVFSSCDQVPVNATFAPVAQQVTAASATDQTYFARLKNTNPTVYGAGATYAVAVTASACIADAFEGDDTPAQARLLTVGGAAATHNFCPSSDADWIKFDAVAGRIYVILTTVQGFAADTVIELFGPDGVTQIAENDDYGYVRASRIVFQAQANGAHFVRIHHHDPVASGATTQYGVQVQEGFCLPDDQEGAAGNNGPGDAQALPPNGAQNHNFCADPLRTDLGDQDWMRFTTVPGGAYQIETTALGANSDTVLQLYDPDGLLLESNDDRGPGRAARVELNATGAGTYYVRAVQFDSAINGAETGYQVKLSATEPTPTPTPSPTALPTPTPTPTPDPNGVKTVILVNRARMETLYGAPANNTLMQKVSQLAAHTAVQGAILPVENDASVAAAYAAWTVDATTLADNAKANAVAAAVRGRFLAFAGGSTSIKYVIVVGDDRAIPFRRVVDRVAPQGATGGSIEVNYAASVVEDGAIRAALAANMVLTDDYLVDKEPGQWQDNQHNTYELYLPDYAVGRLIETPQEIGAFIDNFLGGDTTITTSKVLVTGYDFVQDSAASMEGLFTNDNLQTDAQLIGSAWPGNSLRTKFLSAAPRFDIYAVNGHSTHLAAGVPDHQDIVASEVAMATTDLSGALVFAIGCHGGLNEPGALDLPQAYLQKLANYVGNTGFGWGGGGVVYSEALMRYYTREILRDTKASIGPALTAAKLKYYSQRPDINAYDAKVLMQVTLYGLPMVEVTSGGTLNDENPFPSAEGTSTPPTAFGAIAEGRVGYRLPDSFGAFGEESSSQGNSFDLDGNVTFSAGSPVQPQYFVDVSAPAAGALHGILFLGGVYSDVVGVDPVIALADNEYVVDKTEPTFHTDGFYPAVPIVARAAAPNTVVMSLGQFKSESGGAGTTRLYDRMALGTFYSNSPDTVPAAVTFVDGILDPSAGVGHVKVEANDTTGVLRVVVAFDTGLGQWQSSELTFDSAAQKWSGVITGTATTQFFVQVVDTAGNVAVDDNKGRYYPLVLPLPLATGRELDTTRHVYLPLIDK